MTTEERLKKLPKWAQKYIEQKNDEIAGHNLEVQSLLSQIKSPAEIPPDIPKPSKKR